MKDQSEFTAHGFEGAEPTEADVAHYYEKARKAALYIVENLARKALTENPDSPYKEFVMSMGIASFSTVDGKDTTQWADFACLDAALELDDFLGRWDSELYLTGEPMRFTATGPMVHNW